MECENELDFEDAPYLAKLQSSLKLAVGDIEISRMRCLRAEEAA